MASLGSDYLFVSLGLSVIGVYALTSGHLMTELVMDLTSPQITPCRLAALEFVHITEAHGTAVAVDESGNEQVVGSRWATYLAVAVAAPHAFVKLFTVRRQALTPFSKPIVRQSMGSPTLQWRAQSMRDCLAVTLGSAHCMARRLQLPVPLRAAREVR